MLFSKQEFMEQLDREKFLFNKILALSERQLLVFSDGNLNDDELVKAIEALVNKRKKFMDLIEGIQADMRETAADPQYLEMVNGHRKEKEVIITSIQRNDQQLEQLARKTLGVLGEKLQQTRNNKKAIKAYYGEFNTGGKGWFIDRKK